MQEHIPLHHTFIGAIEEFQNVRLFLGKTNLALIFGYQQLHRRFEGVGPQRKNRILGLLVLTQLGADTGKEDREFEWLGHIVIRTCIQPQNGIGIAVMAGQHQDGRLDPLLAHQAAQLAAIGVWQTDIKDDQIIERLFRTLHRARPILGFEHVKVFGHDQLFAQRLAQIFVIIDKQNFLQLGHRLVLLCCSQQMRSPEPKHKICCKGFTPTCLSDRICFTFLRFLTSKWVDGPAR